MNLSQYLDIRMGNLNVKALTDKEFKIFGLTPNKFGWYKDNKNLEITEDMLSQIKILSVKSKNKFFKNVQTIFTAEGNLKNFSVNKQNAKNKKQNSKNLKGMEMEVENKENYIVKVEKIIFNSPSNGYTIFATKIKKEKISVVGTWLNPTVNEEVKISGKFGMSKYGKQFEASHIELVVKETVEGLVKYLSTVPKIGPASAKLLIKNFKEKTLDVLDNHQDKVIEVLGEVKAKSLLEAWNDSREYNRIIIFLQDSGLGISRALKIYEKYKSNTIEIVKKNPYRIYLDVDGIGFKTADGIALKNGMKVDSEERTQAGIKFIIEEYSSAGHCSITLPEMVKKALKLSLIEEVLLSVLDKEIKSRNIIKDKVNEIDYYYTRNLYYSEVNIAKKLKLLQSSAFEKIPKSDEEILKMAESESNLELTENQKEAILTALKNKVTVITGGPGTGKSSILHCIISVLKISKKNYYLCAPTGRAAKRITETTGESASTIHRLIGIGGNSILPKYNEDNPLENPDYVILDEASMVDLYLMSQLLNAVTPDTNFIMVGDIDQLPSVGCGYVLGDIINSEVFPVVRLTEIHRQAKNSNIILNAHSINKGKSILSEGDFTGNDFQFIEMEEPEDIFNTAVKLMSETIPKICEIENPIADIQLLVPMHKTLVGVESFNKSLQENLNSKNKKFITSGSGVFKVGDKVIQNVNNYRKNVFNGDIGYIINIISDEITINYDGYNVKYSKTEMHEVSLAYAITVHKSQGAAFDVVIIPLVTSHYMLLERNMLYTAVTRARKLCVIIGQKRAVDMAVRNSTSKKRITLLDNRLKNLL